MIGFAEKRKLKRSLCDVTSVRAEELTAPQRTKRLHTVDKPTPSLVPAKSQVICIASGKGGTGKTIVTTNLAVLLAKSGLRVLLLDADLGLANAHLLLGASPTFDISSVIDGNKKMEDIVVECHEGVRLIPGGTGFSELAELKDWRFRFLASELGKLESDIDVMLVDLSAGINPQIMRFLTAAHEIILVTTPDITALIDAYATIKSLSKVRNGAKIKLIINQVRNDDDVQSAFQKLKRITNKHLHGIDISIFGWLPHNWYIHNSISKRKPVSLLHPKSLVARRFQGMATKIGEAHSRWRVNQANPDNCDMSFFAKLEQMVFE